MTFDAVGHLYATYGKVLVIDPQARLRRRIPVPEHPTNCVLGGGDGRVLYVTARTGLYRTRNAISAVGLRSSGPSGEKGTPERGR